MKQPAQSAVAIGDERLSGDNSIASAGPRMRFSLIQLLAFIAILGAVLGISTGAYRLGYLHGRTDTIHRRSADVQLSIYESWWIREHPDEPFPTDWPVTP